MTPPHMHTHTPRPLAVLGHWESGLRPAQLQGALLTMAAALESGFPAALPETTAQWEEERAWGCCPPLAPVLVGGGEGAHSWPLDRRLL